MRIPGKALLGLELQHKEAKTRNSSREELLESLNGVTTGQICGSGRRQSLGGLSPPWGYQAGMMCSALLLLPAPQKRSLWLLVPCRPTVRGRSYF